LRRHLTTKNEFLANKSLYFWKEICKQPDLKRTAVTISTKAHIASFQVSYLIAKNKKPISKAVNDYFTAEDISGAN
jgi:hypothetical protein